MENPLTDLQRLSAYQALKAAAYKSSQKVKREKQQSHANKHKNTPPKHTKHATYPYNSTAHASVAAVGSASKGSNTWSTLKFKHFNPIEHNLKEINLKEIETVPDDLLKVMPKTLSLIKVKHGINGSVTRFETTQKNTWLALKTLRVDVDPVTQKPESIRPHNKPLDSIVYEYYVGCKLNELISKYPIFIPTLGLVKLKKQTLKTNEVLTYGVDVQYEPLRHDEMQKNIRDDCAGSTPQSALVLPYLHGCKTLLDYCDDYCKGHSSNDSYLFLHQLVGTLAIIYACLSDLKDTFTHYDLHMGNVLITPLSDHFVKYKIVTRHNDEVEICLPFTVHIIDYGRSFCEGVTNKIKEITENCNHGTGKCENANDVSDLLLLDTVRQWFQKNEKNTIFGSDKHVWEIINLFLNGSFVQNRYILQECTQDTKDTNKHFQTIVKNIDDAASTLVTRYAKMKHRIKPCVNQSQLYFTHTINAIRLSLAYTITKESDVGQSARSRSDSVSSVRDSDVGQSARPQSNSVRSVRDSDIKEIQRSYSYRPVNPIADTPYDPDPLSSTYFS